MAATAGLDFVHLEWIGSLDCFHLLLLRSHVSDRLCVCFSVILCPWST